MKDVEIIITRETAALTQAGFGMPLIIGTAGMKAYAECAELAEVADAGYVSTSEVYKMAAAVFGQNPRPPKVAVVGFASSEDLADDLNSLITEHNDWYFLLCEEQTEAAITVLASWAAANKKLYFAMLDDDVEANIDLAGDLANDRVVLIYHDGGDYADAAWVGRCAPELPGSITWKFKTLQGIAPVAISTTNIGALHKAHVNTYVQKYGINQTSEGQTTAGEYIDVIRGQDWVEARLAEGISRLLFISPKVPYDTRGIALVVSEVEAVMKQAVANDIIARDEDGNGIYTVSAPSITDISANDRAARHLPDVCFEFTLAGAIHSVVVRGVITI